MLKSVEICGMRSHQYRFHQPDRTDLLQPGQLRGMPFFFYSLIELIETDFLFTEGLRANTDMLNTLT